MSSSFCSYLFVRLRSARDFAGSGLSQKDLGPGEGEEMGWGILKSFACVFLSQLYLSPAVRWRPECGSAPPCTGTAAASRGRARSHFPSATWRWHRSHRSPLRRTRTLCACYGHGEPSCCSTALSPGGAEPWPWHCRLDRDPWAVSNHGGTSAVLLSLPMVCCSGSGQEHTPLGMPHQCQAAQSLLQLFTWAISIFKENCCHCCHAQLDYMQQDRSTAMVNPQT